MLRSTATFDLFSMKHLHHHYTMKPSSLSKRTNKVYGDSTSSSSPAIHDPLTATMLPVTMNYFEVASSSSSVSSFSTNVNCIRDIRDSFSFSSIMNIDGPATRALEDSIRMSKRRFVAETSAASVDGGNKTLPNKRNKPSENLPSVQNCHSNPLLNDWNSVYNCLFTTVPVDETIPTRMFEPFPTIECTFDETDIIVPDCS